MPTRLGLGTVQLGVSYGNRSHLETMSESAAQKILELSKTSGITYYDTAAAYGQSEERLGRFQIKNPRNNFRIATKIPPTSKDIWSNNKRFQQFVFDSIKQSHFRLKCDHVDTVLFHQCEIDFLEHPSVKNAIRNTLNENLCSKFGVSVYEPIQAQAALAIDEISCLQIPLNLLDLRFAHSSLTNLYKAQGIEVIARSVFLQGLLVEEATLPEVKRKDELLYLKGMCVDASRKELHTSLEEISLNFALTHFHEFLDVAVVGVQSSDEFAKNLTMIDKDRKKIESKTLNQFAAIREYANDQKLTNPSSWDQ